MFIKDLEGTPYPKRSTEPWNLKQQNLLGLQNEGPRKNTRPKIFQISLDKKNEPSPGGGKPRPGQKIPSQPILKKEVRKSTCKK